MHAALVAHAPHRRGGILVACAVLRSKLAHCSDRSFDLTLLFGHPPSELALGEGGKQGAPCYTPLARCVVEAPNKRIVQRYEDLSPCHFLQDILDIAPCPA
jgi:hypothetical protein